MICIVVCEYCNKEFDAHDPYDEQVQTLCSFFCKLMKKNSLAAVHMWMLTLSPQQIERLDLILKQQWMVNNLPSLLDYTTKHKDHD